MSNCEICHRKNEINNARLERANKRLFALVMVLIFALIGTNIGWLIYESRYETVTTEEVMQYADNDSDIIYAGGDITYGR